MPSKPLCSPPFLPSPERFGQPYETRLFLPDDVAGGRCRRSGAHGTGRRLRRYALGVRCTFRRLCSGVVLCPPHDAAEKLMPLSFTESIYKEARDSSVSPDTMRVPRFCGYFNYSKLFVRSLRTCRTCIGTSRSRHFSRARHLGMKETLRRLVLNALTFYLKRTCV